MKTIAALVVLLVTGAAAAQTPPPPASTAGTAGVKQHLQSLHYGNVQNLRRGPDGQWTGKATKPEAHARNAVFYGDKAINRSPCGTGTSARMAQLAAKGKLAVGDEFVHESIIGSLFKGRVEAATTVANRPAIIPSIAGWARMTGYNTIFIDDRDPFAHGFVVT